ncbi:hypothetical protein, partial [Yoonia sp.]|uniref:hypothetical protein n=1 Tax=Yoonia sp. TaxID=2212373 RepID=UPI002E01AA50|nr:hypothetical protein [Yoonia sp.]
CIESYSPCIKSIQGDRKSLSNSVDISGGARRWFRNLLWMAFPSRSENELANKAAAVLGVSPRQIRNWLREDNDASLRYVFAVLAIAGGEIVFKQIEGRD